jgi:hypothetical protein
MEDIADDGIGVFMNHENITYMEIMKKLADQQKLYMMTVARHTSSPFTMQ